MVAQSQAESTHVFLVSQGVLELTVSLSNGHDHVLTHLHAGALLGLADAFGDRTCGEQQIFRAHTPTTLWLIPVETFRDCMAQDSVMAETVVHLLATRVRRLVDEVANTSLLSAKARVARLLLARAPAKNAAQPWALHAGEAVALSQFHLARMLGLSRQSVGLFLREFEAAETRGA